MSRSHSLVGLSREARNFLAQNGQRTEVKLSDNLETHAFPVLVTEKVKKLCVNAFGCGNGPKGCSCETYLKRYTLKTGEKVEEYIQAEPWSGGPNTFLALRNLQTGEEIGKWSEEEMNQY